MKNQCRHKPDHGYINIYIYIYSPLLSFVLKSNTELLDDETCYFVFDQNNNNNKNNILTKTSMVWVGLKAPDLKLSVNVIIAFEETVNMKAKKAFHSEISKQLVN